jgi:hypothetical protein
MNPRTGGWRYDFASEDPGDTSQFGWQGMLMHSASSSGLVQLSPAMRSAMQRFLDSVRTGRSGGLAVYRNVTPNEVPSYNAATPAMSAEALSMRLMLGYPTTAQGKAEARDLLLNNLPGRSEENLYYWYYGTIAMYQMRDGHSQDSQAPLVGPNDAWRLWNEAIKTQLVSTQVPTGSSAGSWNPTCIWGSYGGRVYSTAIGCMCLEVYYRYLPIYHDDEQLAQRPANPAR